MRKLILSTFILSFFIYLVSSAGNTPHDYFTRLAHAFTQGKYYLTENPSWLSELIPSGANVFYTVYPPMPAILAIPFITIFGNQFPQQILAHLVGAAFAATMVAISLTIKKDKSLTIWTAVLTSIGTITWFLSSNGSVWYLGQITAAMFLALALYEGLTKKRPYLVGLLLGAAYLSRVDAILSLPIYIYLLRNEIRTSKGLIEFVLPLGGLIALDSLYNFVRFGVPWNKGYYLIPGVLDEPWNSKGLIHPSYILNGLTVAFSSLPKIINKTPFIQPSWSGLAIWITTPVFVFAFWSRWKETIVKLSWLTIVAIFIFVLMHGSTGFTQFGYRFAVDFYPFLMFLTIKGVARMKGPRWYHWLLLLIGVAVNLWGVLWINKFGWVSY